MLVVLSASQGGASETIMVQEVQHLGQKPKTIKNRGMIPGAEIQIFMLSDTGCNTLRMNVGFQSWEVFLLE